jgi:hypothetical protein
VAFDPAVGMVRVILKNGETRHLKFLALSKEDQECIKKNAPREQTPCRRISHFHTHVCHDSSAA